MNKFFGKWWCPGGNRNLSMYLMNKIFGKWWCPGGNRNLFCTSRVGPKWLNDF
jgi:hypothetical protein